MLKLREAYSDILQYDKYIEDLIVNRKKEFIFNNTGIREIRERKTDGKDWIVKNIKNNKKIRSKEVELELKKYNFLNSFFLKYYSENIRQYNKKSIFFSFNNIEMKKNILLKIVEIIGRIDEIVNFEICYRNSYEYKNFFNSYGSDKSYILYESEIIISYTLKEKLREELITYYDIGTEALDSVLKNIEFEIKKDILFSKYANKINKKVSTCIFSPYATGLIVHECFGHLSEIDNENKYYEWIIGTKIAKDFINIVDSGDIMGSGYLPFDDEGVDSISVNIVKNGVINSYLTDMKSGILRNHILTGNARAKRLTDIPIVRLRTTYMKAGNNSPYDLFKNIEKGVYIEDFRNAYIKNDKVYLNLHKAYLIENGKITNPVIAEKIICNILDIFKNIDMISNKVEFFNTTLGGCNKKGQNHLRVSYGGPYSRIQEIYIT